MKTKTEKNKIPDYFMLDDNFKKILSSMKVGDKFGFTNESSPKNVKHFTIIRDE